MMSLGSKLPLVVRLAQFRTRWRGVAGVGDTAANKGQCVGLVEVWIDTLGLPHVWGNAKDLLVDASVDHFDRVLNKPMNYPAPGDIIVWGESWGGGYGHTGVVVSAGVMSFTAFQQNDPDGSAPHEKSYGYSGVVGWLHPLV